jgi:plastocyanin
MIARVRRLLMMGGGVRAASTMSLATLAAILASAAAAPAALADANVAIVNSHYRPTPLMIMQGETVTWKNEGFLLHTVTAENGEFDSGTIRAGGEFSLTFTKAGTFAYTCTIHPSMFGKVIVQAHEAGDMGGMGHEEHAGASPPAMTTPAGTARVALQLSKAAHAGRRWTRVTVASSRPGAQVLLQLYSREHFAWIQVAHATLSASGGAAFRLSAKLHRQVRAIVVGQPGEGPSISQTLRS